jgi:AraC family transcriptional regulator
MPYKRSLRLQTSLLSWHDITLLEPVSAWSDAYRAASPRLLIPQTHWLECERGGQRYVCDSVCPLWLTPDHEYRMRQPWVGQRSVVLTLNDALPGVAACRPTLPVGSALFLAQWAKALEAGRVELLEAEECLLEFVHGVLGHEVRSAPRAHRAVERAREHLAAQPHRNDSLSEIAAIAHCSPFHLARQFRCHSGVSLHGYRTRLRMSAAIQRLRDGESNLSLLAADLGYSSHSHFTSMFRRSFGATPHQVRTNLTARRAH